MRLLLLVMSVMLTSVACASAKTSTVPYSKSPTKHAVLVMDADTKKVLYHENGYDRRFPASLTKMMTLYMAFDAMRQGKLKTGTTMKASRLAAKQQQTNISMKHGYKISVDLAIKALVVRSANDVAVVFAEKLGGNTSRFATMMTQKAQSLGMRHTVFKNPHGLPNSGQYSTAYDMAILGVALRRDFPQYYHYFNTTQFTYRKKTYKTHNRVLKDFAHVDGIKTGYIRASGFNVVSSAKKDGFNIVAAVMGGASSKARDGYMKETLNRTFASLKKQNRGTRQMARAPKPYQNPRRKAQQQRTVAKINVEVNAIPTATPVSAKKKVTVPKPKPALAPKQRRFEPQVQAPVVKENLDIAALINEPKPVLRPKAIAATKEVAKVTRIPKLVPKKVAQAPTLVEFAPKKAVAPNLKPSQIARVAPSAKVSIRNVVKKSARAQAVAPKGTLDFQMANLSSAPKASVKLSANEKSLGTITRRVATKAPAYSPTKEWGIQVGAFKDKKTAKLALSRAFSLVRDEAKGAKVDIATQGHQQASSIHRARLGNLSRKQAHHICQKLQSLAQACFPLRVN